MSRRRNIVLLLAVGSLLVAGALFLRASRRPQAAPPGVQQEGRLIVAVELGRLRNTEFGRTPRGQRILDEVSGLLADGRIVFSAGLGQARGLSWCEILGVRRVYVKVIEMAEGRYLHQTADQVMEVLAHESVHWINGRFRGTSLEEECDGFAAGLCVSAAVQGQEAPGLLTHDGLPLAEFIRRQYPGIRSDPDYHPVGETREWLRRRAGL